MNDTYKLLEILENPECFQINRLKAHSDHTYYSTLDEAKKGVDVTEILIKRKMGI